MVPWLQSIADSKIRRQFRSNVHCLDGENGGVVFVRNSFCAFDCPKPLLNSLSDFMAGASRKEACELHGSQPEKLEAFLSVLCSRIEAPLETPAPTDGRKVLERLVLNISNGCNLRCVYCYAGGGNYGSTPAFMDRATAFAAVEAFTGGFDHIEAIQFFGGEPLLNPELIDFVCEEFERRHTAGGVAGLPRFGIVTNGTLASPSMFDLFKKHDIKVTVSIDGPEPVHDHLRGQGSFQKVRAFVDELNRRQIDYGIEGTYTAYHAQSGWTLAGLLDFYFAHFQRTEVHVPAVCLPRGHPLALDDPATEEAYLLALNHSLDDLGCQRSACSSFASRLIDAYANHRPIRQYCAAGSGTLSVDTEGFIYPCFMFTGMPEFRLGNVHGNDSFPGGDARRIEEMLKSAAKQGEECQECWAAPLCSGCVGADFFRTGGGFEKTGCAATKAMAREFLLRIPFLSPSKTVDVQNVEKGGSSGDH